MPNHLGFNIVYLKGAVVHVVLPLSLGHEKRVVVSVVCTAVNVDEASDRDLLTIGRNHQQIRRDQVKSPDIVVQRLCEILADQTEVS